LGLGFGVWGFGFWALAPTPKPPIPNPQSPSKTNKIIKFSKNLIFNNLVYSNNKFFNILNKIILQ
jgi:hypothetical protein